MGVGKRPEDYRWCSYAAAVGGMRLARSGLVAAITFGRRTTWAKAHDRYREYLFGIARKVRGGATPDGNVKAIGGCTLAEIEAVLAAGGKLTLPQVLRCRVRYLTDGAVLGGQEFVDEFFDRQRIHFGEARRGGARRMKAAAWGAIRVLRDLKADVVALPE